ncbi:uncharacterized protein B0H64DRAFT_395836 [Chaetomium fimeti]|uniref:Uncharacterized protein n=1 Tax=Chaetomium fimeti TaxID=1854472 RepID=A0AAE0LSW9_9PEZI|nr:hypothetical protein B0H64DRAFT_395836 [Chaetomium fimeti]
MFSLRASVPARRAACAILQPNVLTSQLLVPPCHGQAQQQQPPHHQQRQQRRQYAMRSPSLSKRPRPGPAAPVDPLFKDVPVPSVDLWREFKNKRGLGDVTPETCLHAFTQFCLVASGGFSSGEPAIILQRDFNIDLITLHYTALPLITGEARLGTVGYSMLFVASNMGYIPSTITAMGIVTQSGKQPDFAKSKTWRALETNFKRLLRTENNPDVFTVQGLVLLHQGQPDSYVLSFFDKAIQAAGGTSPRTADQPGPGEQGIPAIRKPRWTYENFCHLERGRLLLKRNRTEEAVASFKTAALELDHPDGYVELAKLLPDDAPERETYLLMAAQTGNFEACRLLALYMADKAADPALPRDDRAHAGKMAREWAMIGPDPEKRGEVEAQVNEKLKGTTPLG